MSEGASQPSYAGRTHLPLRCSGSTVSLTGKTLTAQRRPALRVRPSIRIWEKGKPSVLEQYNFSTKRAQLLVKEKTLKSSKTSPSPAGTAADTSLQQLRSSRAATKPQLVQQIKLTSLNFNKKISVQQLKKQQNIVSEALATIHSTDIFSPSEKQEIRRQAAQDKLQECYIPSSYGWQVNFLDNLKYVIIKLTLSVLETMEIKNRAELLSIRDKSLIKADELNSLLGVPSTDNGGSYLVKKTEDILAHIFQQPFSFTFYDNYIS